jgi:hypothetical protein
MPATHYLVGVNHQILELEAILELANALTLKTFFFQL